MKEYEYKFVVPKLIPGADAKEQAKAREQEKEQLAAEGWQLWAASSGMLVYAREVEAQRGGNSRNDGF